VLNLLVGLPSRLLKDFYSRSVPPSKARYQQQRPDHRALANLWPRDPDAPARLLGPHHSLSGRFDRNTFSIHSFLPLEKTINLKHGVGFHANILIHPSREEPNATPSCPRRVRVLMGTHGSVTRLIIDLRSDEPALREAAARLVWGRYFKELLVLARNHLSARIRCREDEEDVLQSMYKSFCSRQRRGDFDLANRDELWNLLVQITLRKARNTATRHLQGKRDVRREGAKGVDQSSESPPGSILDQIDSGGPTPAEAALLNEALEQRFERLSDPALRQIALWKLEGYTNPEIAKELECTVRTVERKLERIRAYWGTGDD
jgi:RNA polymerase sigma factor (sigma-70 family)